jgi:multidrug efflux pump subunit AcrB
MRFNLSEWALRHRSLVTYLMLVIAAAGLWSYVRLGRSEDPDFTVKTMVVQASWPGATLADTLEQVTDRIESKLQETPSLDYLKSYTSAGQTTIFVNLKDSTRPSQVPDIWYQVRKKVRDIANTLPQGIVGPGFNDEFGDTYGIVYGFTADGFTDRELRDYVVDVRKQLLQLPDISKIDILGAQDERVYVEFSEKQLSGLGIDRSALIAALQAQNAVTPTGIVQTGDEKILVRVSGAFRSEQDVLAVNFVAKNGRIIRLGDIAEVTRGPADPAQPMFRVNGRQGIGLAITMRKGGDVLALGRNVEHAMAEITANLPVGIEPTLVADQPVTVAHAVDDFMEALWEAVAIVLAVSLVSLGLRAGAVVAISIPLVLAAVFVTMSFAGIDLQRISLGALIIALGLLVDDAMITVEMMVTHLERGDDKEKAATFAYTSTAFPMLTGTLVTVAGFVPIGFAHSAAGEYTFSIFAVVAIALLVSWLVAVLFAPLLGVWVLKKPKAVHSGEPGSIMRHFRRFLVLAMRARWVTLLATLCLFGAAIYGMRLVPQQFFPSSDRPELMVDLQLPENASIYATRDISARVDQLLAGDQDVDHWSTYVGQGAVRFYLPLNVQLPNDFFAQLVVVTKGLQQRERVKAKLEQALATEFPSVVGRVYPLELGPPVGWPLQYRVSGVEPEQVRAIAFKVAQILNEDPSARNVNYNWMEPARTVRIRVDQDQARLLGLSSEALAQALNTVMSGITATQMRSGIYLVDVLVRASADQRVSLSTIRALQVPLPNGQTVPLSQIASVGYGQEYPIVWRRDRRPTVTVQADAAPGVQAATVVQALAPKIEALNASLPGGYHIVVGGTVEESSKAQSSVAAVLPLMLILILTVLMIQLQSFNRLFLVLSVAPLGLIGVVAALLLADKPLGFVALLGVLALTGMIARNSVILIDQIEKEKVHGRHPWDAVVEATSHRFRPILLTASAAILGMIPIAPTIFWGPMAYAIMGGLAVATLLTLVFLPALYVTWFRIRRPDPALLPQSGSQADPAAQPPASGEETRDPGSSVGSDHPAQAGERTPPVHVIGRRARRLLNGLGAAPGISHICTCWRRLCTWTQTSSARFRRSSGPS